MALFRPNISLSSITEIDALLLKKYRIKALMLDVDNTLSLHGHPEPFEGIIPWVETMKEQGIELIIVSNNSAQRVRPFAKKLDIPCVGGGYKPLSKGMKEAQQHLKASKEHTAMVGDQLFTDILGGNLYGITTILVAPFALEDKTGFKVKRFLERKIMRTFGDGGERRRHGSDIRPSGHQ